MRDSLKRIGNLSPAKLDLLAERLRERVSKSAPRQSIPRRSNSQAAPPLSFAQQRLWLIDQMDPGNPAFNVPVAIRLKGQLALHAFKQSFNEILRRHEILRTTFTVHGGQPIQVISPPRMANLSVIDLSELPEEGREREVLRRSREAAGRRFDLSKGPLLHIALLKLDASEHVVLLTMHHIISDAWSMEVLVREFAALYQAFTGGHASPLAELPIQYADYAVWQRDWLQGKVLEAQINYWREQLADAPRDLTLTVDRPRPAVQTYQGSAKSFVFSREVSEGLKAIGQEEGATLFMTLSAAFKLLLSRYCGSHDICIGTSIANRHHPELESLIGFFVNMLVLRTDLSGEPSFRELLRREREVCLAAYAHQDVPFEKLVEELEVERDLSRHPLFQALFVLHNTPRSEIELPGLKMFGQEVVNETAKFDLSILMSEGRENLSGTLIYNTDLFDASIIMRMIGHFQTLLQGIIEDADQGIESLAMTSQEESQQLTSAFNDALE